MVRVMLLCLQEFKSSPDHFTWLNHTRLGDSFIKWFRYSLLPLFQLAVGIRTGDSPPAGLSAICAPSRAVAVCCTTVTGSGPTVTESGLYFSVSYN